MSEPAPSSRINRPIKLEAGDGSSRLDTETTAVGGMLDLHEVKAMFDEAKNAYGSPDEDLLDHLDPDSAFRSDIGGRG